ncbi:MAG: tRNA (adenosine(37)-N6)-threonylcarbamoyltransferase complex ATPase subunit type 1 TsaE [Phycisphaerales bacterium]|nr:tRNA (adenosine(37)-N6)-threonylcarbamoyltransferase complex ATPase subunit type 1 TsaE [Planctomycetota bacterium]MBL6997932.1 tRNA (adenosine(37)-N6)-threonylcarbamoyltransferase complex ATPase subunit type 1 TsaE [Phycisphaerales bacterium]
MTTTNSEQETIDFAKQFALSTQTPTIILLEGELGAGKTCFVRGLCEGLGGDPRQVSSPTFAIIQEYTIEKGKRLIHIDAYRLSGEEELESIGWEELLQDNDAIIAIEWASRIKNATPTTAITIDIAHLDISSRELTISH